MKYIVIQLIFSIDNVRELPFVFPDVVVHKDMADSMVGILKAQFPSAAIKPVAAGFLSSMTFNEDCCNGKSISLHLNSRGKQDSRLLMGMDYFHGIVS